MTLDVSGSDKPVLIDDVPVNKFHVKMTALTFGAHFTDGYAIGSIAIALTMINSQTPLPPVWQGLIASSALIGIFVGALVLGQISDKHGRRKIFMINFILITIASGLQLFVQDPTQLFILRLFVGFALGGDYSVGVALLAEVIPRKPRGALLGCLNVTWNVGYVMSMFIGYAIQHYDPTAWRWLLASSVVPSLLVLLGRVGTPESPRWLVRVGRREEAQKIIDKYIAKDAIVGETDTEIKMKFSTLFEKKYRRRTVFAALIFCANVVPFFAIYTFLPTILEIMGLSENFTTELLVNLMLIIGSLLGMWATVYLTRRHFSIGGFAVCSVTLLMLALLPAGWTIITIIAFVAFSLAINALNNLNSVYPPEVMPTEIRGYGVGFATSMSRVASAIGTFCVPLILSSWGMRACMMILAVCAILATVLCYFWAPDTGNLILSKASGEDVDIPDTNGSSNA